MIGLIRFLVSLAMLAAFVWFAVTVPIGKRTLWGHVTAIFGTQEAKDLVEGTKEEAEKVARKAKEELHRPDMARPAEARPAETPPAHPTHPTPTAPPSGSRKVKAPLAPH